MIEDYRLEDANGILHIFNGRIVFDNDLAEAIVLDSTNIRTVFIDKDYHGKFMPKMFINLILTQSQEFVLYKYRGLYNVEIGSSSYFTQINSQDSVSEGNDLFFSTFRALITDKPLFEDIFTNEDGTRSDLPDEGESIDNISDLWMLLVDQHALEANKARVDNSTPYTNTTVANVCAKMLVSYEGPQPIQFDEPDNTTVYEQILIQNKNLRNSIVLAMQEGAYGVYAGGLTLFIDYHRIYLMSKWGVNGLADEDPLEVVIHHSPQARNVPACVLNDDPMNPIVIAPSGAYTIGKNDLADELSPPVVNYHSSDSFNERISFDNEAEAWEVGDGVLDQVTYDEMNTKEGIAQRSAYAYADDGNILNIQSKHEDGRHRIDIKTTIEDSDPWMFMPNYKYRLSFDSPSEESMFGGSYKITRASHLFTKIDAKGDFRCATIGIFR